MRAAIQIDLIRYGELQYHGVLVEDPQGVWGAYQSVGTRYDANVARAGMTKPAGFYLPQQDNPLSTLECVSRSLLII